MFFPAPGPALAVQPTIVVLWEPVVDNTHPVGKLAIDLATVKKFLNLPVEDTYYDLERTAMILAAQRAIEIYCEMSLVSSSWVGTLPAFYDHIRIDKRPFSSVESIVYVDSQTGVITTLDPSFYVANAIPQRCGMISRSADVDWPEAANRWDGVRITVNVAWPGNVLPEDLQQAMLMTIGAIDKARGDDGGSGSGRASVFAIKHPGMFGASHLIPGAAMALLNPYKLRQVVLA